MGPDEWVAVSFVVFFALVFYAGVHKSAASALDARALSIKEELDQARRLKTEAQTQLAEYQQKREQADAEARKIVDQARAEAEAMAREAREKMTASLQRRTQIAEAKIARAEEQAVAEVRGVAVDTAIAAADKVVREKVSGTDRGRELVADSIAQLPARLS